MGLLEWGGAGRGAAGQAGGAGWGWGLGRWFARAICMFLPTAQFGLTDTEYHYKLTAIDFVPPSPSPTQ